MYNKYELFKKFLPNQGGFMPTHSSSFQAAFGLKNRHLQTIYSSLFRNLPKMAFEIEDFSLSDGDFLQTYWLKTNKRTQQTPLVILFHGLAGSYESPYIQGMMLELSNAGYDSVLMHFRGCSGVPNLHPRSYHSGETEDAKEFIQSVKSRYENAPLFAIGYSLGANMLLKLLGETKENSSLKKAVAISPPMLLDVCADRMNKGFSRYYQHRLLKDLKFALDKKYDSHPMQKLLKLKRQDVKKLKTFWEFDDAYTAPIHGFNSAKQYYKNSSSKQFLKDIQTPSLIIHAQDDPFMTPEVIPSENEMSKFVTLELSKNGGHVGFVSGNFFKATYWLERRVLEYFA